jgi:hypothetical protein
MKQMIEPDWDAVLGLACVAYLELGLFACIAYFELDLKSIIITR